MKVIANTGLLVPMEWQPRRYIGDGEAVTVEDSAYYRRQIADGDLIVIDETAAQTVPTGTAADSEQDSQKGNA